MRRSVLISLLAVLFFLLVAAGASAQLSTDQATQIEGGSLAITDQGSTDGGAAAVVQAIETMFGVNADQINAWRADDNLGYGEIVILLALAQELGVSAEDLLLTHKGPPVVGWGKIAQDQGLNLGKLVSDVVKVAERSQAILKAQSASDNGNSNSNGRSGDALSGAGAGSGSNNPGSGYRR